MQNQALSLLDAHGLAPRLIDEILQALNSAHLNLLEFFARNVPNVYRIEIRLFRSLLKDVVDWANQADSLNTIAHKARWWESYWYEREYGDSLFEPLSLDEKRDLHRRSKSFYRNHVNIWAATLDHSKLKAQLITASALVGYTLPEFKPISDQPTLQDARFSIDNASPTTASLLLWTVAGQVATSDPAAFTQDYLYFLDGLSPSIRVQWRSDSSKIAVAIDTPLIKCVVTSKTALGPEAASWRAQQLENVRCDKNVGDEDGRDVVQEVRQRLRNAA